MQGSGVRAIPRQKGTAGSEPPHKMLDTRVSPIPRERRAGGSAPSPRPLLRATRGSVPRPPVPAHLRLLRPERRLPLSARHQRLQQLQQPHHGRHQPGHGVGPEAGGEAAQLGAQRSRHAIDVRRGQPARRRSPQRLRHRPAQAPPGPARPAPSGAAPEAGKAHASPFVQNLLSGKVGDNNNNA